MKKYKTIALLTVMIALTSCDIETPERIKELCTPKLVTEIDGVKLYRHSGGCPGSGGRDVFFSVNGTSSVTSNGKTVDLHTVPNTNINKR